MAQYQRIEFNIPVPRIKKTGGITVSMAGDINVVSRVRKTDDQVNQVDIESINWNGADITELVMHSHYMLELRSEVSSIAASIHDSLMHEKMEVAGA